MADGFRRLDSPCPEGGPRRHRVGGKGEFARRAFSGGVPDRAQGWLGNLGERYCGGCFGKRPPSRDGRHHHRYHRAEAARKSVAAVAENGSGRQAGGRHRARFQQSLDHYQGLRGAGFATHRDSAGDARRRDADRKRLRTRFHADPPIAGLQPEASPAAKNHRLEQHCSGTGQTAGAADGRTHRNGDTLPSTSGERKGRSRRRSSR